MLKQDSKSAVYYAKNNKLGSIKTNYVSALSSGLSRRAFLKTATAISMLAGLTACQPSSPDLNEKDLNNSNLESYTGFNQAQKESLDAVQMRLFPDDGNGPNARDLNALAYLEWAMSDPQNISDGDPEFIAKGIGWLNDLAEQTQGDSFIKLKNHQQDKVLRQISQSEAGENWLSILIYYLTEALMLDPIYGGNPDSVGWKWLQHQAGFPRPVVGKTYRDFE